MNVFALIILPAILAEVFLHIFADVLNLRALHEDLPSGFQDVFDEEGYGKSQKYLRTNTRFGWLTSGFSLAVFLAFWFGRGFPFLDGWMRSLEQGPILTGLLFIGTLAVVKGLLSLPFKLYGTFVIEERFGFNRTSRRVFFMDMLKATFLGVVLGVPLIAGILAFFQFAGEHAWIYCWFAVTLFMLGVTFVAPTWIMPLFNKFTPLEPGELRSAILSYARSIDFPVENIYVMDGSKRSGKSNAFFTGFGKHRRIVLFDTLIEQHAVPELVAVLAHETGHFKKKHVLKTLILGIVQTGVMFYILSLFISSQGLFDAFYVGPRSVYAGLVFFAILYSPLEFVMGLFLKMWSRRNEREADRFAVETTRNPRAFAMALKKLSVHNLSNLQPHPFYVFLNYSHPPILERIRDINRISG
ncbi:MAG: M48 family metallopeptidase [Desulfatiglandaceae bacterium]